MCLNASEELAHMDSDLHLRKHAPHHDEMICDDGLLYYVRVPWASNEHNAGQVTGHFSPAPFSSLYAPLFAARLHYSPVYSVPPSLFRSLFVHPCRTQLISSLT